MRIRTIKPEFWMHEGLCRCSEFTRLLAIALLNWADDEGYFMANPILIRGQVFPFLDDSKMIPRSLQDLSSVGWIQLGNDNQGREVGRVLNFKKHQRVDKPKPSEIKASSTFQDESKTIPRIVQDASKEEWKGKERKGGEEEQLPQLDFPHSKPDSPHRRATFEQVMTFGKGQMPPISDDCCEKFFDRMEAEGWINKQGFPLADWRARFREWAGAWSSNAANPNKTGR